MISNASHSDGAGLTFLRMPLCSLCIGRDDRPGLVGVSIESMGAQALMWTHVSSGDASSTPYENTSVAVSSRTEQMICASRYGRD